MDDDKNNEAEPELPEHEEPEEEASSEALAPPDALAGRVAADVEKGVAPSQLGATRYVLAGFFAAGIGVAYVVGRTLTTGWNKLAETQWAIDKAPWLTQIGEDDRYTYGTIAGALIGVLALVYVYRRQDIRVWVNEAAAELAKVTWPTKKEVTNSTFVVIAASHIATVYLALLDRFWGFVTNLVYGV